MTRSPAPRPSPDAIMPTRVGARYDVLDRLGRGGSAVVYRVRDRSHPAELALKQLLTAGPAHESESRALFEREFCVLAQLKHPSAVEVYDFGVDPEGPFYTMELLDGGDLSARAPWPLTAACEALMQVCSLLSLLHARGFVHRDVTPRNVRFTPDGAAKLIDFGAMVRFGPCAQGVGTPGFVAPEVVHHLRLDARTDLFSVGATLYYALTGQRPFAARTLADLNELWRVDPVPVSALAPDIPPALDALITSLLQVDPARRPSSAFEVMQRLAALCGTQLTASSEIAHAYLSTPLFVGREREQRRARAWLRRASYGEGSALLFEGQSGCGRSRLLDTCVLDAKTSGAVVLRADGRSASQAAFSCARQLLQQLLAALPDDAQRGAPNPLFAAAVSGGTDALRPLADWAADPARTRAAWLSALARVSGNHTLVIAIDDIERIDAASLAVLAAWVGAAERARWLLLGTLESGVELDAQPSLAFVHAHCCVLPLAPLDAQAIDVLFASIFADAPHTALVSDRIYKLAGGSPRAAMSVAQYMLERQLIRYEGGSWILPAELALSELPASVEDALSQQLTALPGPARRLIQAQALTFDAPWRRGDYLALVACPAPELDDALRRLSQQGLLAHDAGRYTLAHPGVRSAVLSQLTAAERSAHERELARWAVRTRRSAWVEAHHLLQADQREPGLERLAGALEGLPNTSEAYLRLGIDPKLFAAMLERAHALSSRAGRPRREACELARRLLALSLLTEDAIYYRYAPDLVAQLASDAELVQTRTLPPVYTRVEAIAHLAHYVGISSVIGGRTLDLPLLASLPALLAPIAELTPALGALHRVATYMPKYVYEAQREQARSETIALHRDLEGVGIESIPFVARLRHEVAAMTATLEVLLGQRSAEHWIAATAADPLRRSAALKIQRALCILDGDLENAERYRKQAEVAAAQASSPQTLERSSVSLELSLQVHIGDLAGVKHAADRIAHLASRCPGWQPMHALAQGYFHRLRGDLPAARSAFERALEASDPADGPALRVAWVQAAEGCVRVLTDLGELAQARALGLASSARCARLAITGFPGLVRALALAEAKLGEHARAAERLDALIAQHADRRAWLRALDFEARALVAIAAGDAVAAARFTQLALSGSAAEGGALPAAGARLLDEAQKAGLELRLPRSVFESQLMTRPSRPHLPAAERMQLEAALAAEAGASSRARRALELICQALAAKAGQLYYALPSGLARSAHQGEPDASLDRFANGYWQQRELHAAMTTVFTETEKSDGSFAVARWTSPSGVSYSVLPLSPRGEAECIGLVAVAVQLGAVASNQWALLAALSQRLADLGDVTQG